MKYSHPVLAVNDGVFNSASGIVVNIRKPTVDMIKIEDIAASLSKINRFNGHTKVPYNVAQHSVLVSFLAPQDKKLAALLHDAAEAYVGDVIKPLKVILGDRFAEIEEGFEKVICERFDITLEDIAAIKPLDNQALELEFDAFVKGNMLPWDLMWDNKFDIQYAAWNSAYAEIRFLQEYRKLIINSGRSF